MTEFDDFRKKLLEDPDTAREYEAHRPEFEVARALIRARNAARMTQAEVARKMHTSQTQVARMESGNHLPSLQSISRYAHAINQTIRLEVHP